MKLECVPRFFYLSNTLGAGRGVEEAARARMRCAWAKFKELCPILTAHGASYRIKVKSSGEKRKPENLPMGGESC